MFLTAYKILNNYPTIPEKPQFLLLIVFSHIGILDPNPHQNFMAFLCQNIGNEANGRKGKMAKVLDEKHDLNWLALIARSSLKPLFTMAPISLFTVT